MPFQLCQAPTIAVSRGVRHVTVAQFASCGSERIGGHRAGAGVGLSDEAVKTRNLYPTKFHRSVPPVASALARFSQSGATVLIVKGAFVYFLALHLLGLPWRPVLQHGVENCQELVHTRCQGDFFDFPRGEEPLVKSFNLRVVARGHEGPHV
jgi:hypothetical protein